MFLAPEHLVNRVDNSHFCRWEQYVTQLSNEVSKTGYPRISLCQTMLQQNWSLKDATKNHPEVVQPPWLQLYDYVIQPQKNQFISFSANFLWTLKMKTTLRINQYLQCIYLRDICRTTKKTFAFLCSGTMLIFYHHQHLTNLAMFSVQSKRRSHCPFHSTWFTVHNITITTHYSTLSEANYHTNKSCCIQNGRASHEWCPLTGINPSKSGIPTTCSNKEAGGSQQTILLNIALQVKIQYHKMKRQQHCGISSKVIATS